jgi:tRNA G18 (ribose-2'-O)-methylase SpoU
VTTKLRVPSGWPLHARCGEVLPPSPVCASANGEPSVTSSLVRSNEGTDGSFWYGSSATGRSKVMGSILVRQRHPSSATLAHTDGMARLTSVSDPADPRLADYVALRDVQLRQHLEVERGLFIAEGEKVIRRAVAAGYPVRSFLMASRWVDGLRDELAAAGDAPCFVVDEALAQQVTGFHVHRGALAALHRPALPTIDEAIAGAERIVVLEDIVDHTNVGAIFRSAAALGVDAALLSPRCADPLYRRAIKVAMGAVFAMPWTRLPEWYDALPALSAAGFTTVALTPAPDALDLADLADRVAGERLCLVVGGEGHGLSQRWLSTADLRTAIPMAAGVDSLNVAAAAAIAFYATRQPHIVPSMGRRVRAG